MTRQLERQALEEKEKDDDDEDGDGDGDGATGKKKKKKKKKRGPKVQTDPPQFQYVTCILMVYFPKDKNANTHPHKMGEQLLGELQVKKRKH